MWHSSVWYLVFLINIILYVIVVLIVRKTAKIQLPLCQRHRRMRWKMIASWILGLGGVAVAIMGGASSTTQEISNACVVISLVMFVAGIIEALIVTQLIVVQKIDDHLIWLKKINGAFLDEMPAWNR